MTHLYILILRNSATIFIKIFLLIGMTLSFQGCVSVKAYQKMYLNDANMSLNSRKIEIYEHHVESYREGASGITTGKSGGGCGCN